MEQEQDEKNWVAAMADMQARLEVLEAAELERVRQAEVAAEVARLRAEEDASKREVARAHAEEEKKARVQRRERREARQAKSDAELAAIKDQLEVQTVAAVEARRKLEEDDERLAATNADIEARMRANIENIAIYSRDMEHHAKFDAIFHRHQFVASPGTTPSDTEKEKDRVDEKKKDG